MGRITAESGRKIIQYNREILYHIPAEYEGINSYLEKSSLRDTLFSILRYLVNKEIIIDHHRYTFILDTKRLTYGIRKKKGGEGTTNRHINLLCALGFFTKRTDPLRANDEFRKTNPDRRLDINTFSFRRYSKKEMKRIEQRAKLLRGGGVTSGNISFNYLMNNGLFDIAEEVYPKNNKTAPEKKLVEYSELLEVMTFIIDAQGYATRQQIQDNLLIDDREIKKVFSIFKRDIESTFFYKRPTKEQIKKWELKSLKYIYTNKEK